jgi:hypothetical protein
MYKRGKKEGKKFRQEKILTFPLEGKNIIFAWGGGLRTIEILLYWSVHTSETEKWSLPPPPHS